MSQPKPLSFEPTKVQQGTTIIEYDKITKMRIWSSSLREVGNALAYLTIESADARIAERFSLGKKESECFERLTAAVRFFIMPVVVNKYIQELQSTPGGGVKIGIYKLTEKGIENGFWIFKKTLPWNEYAGCLLNKTFHPVGGDLTEMRPAMLRIFDIGMYKKMKNGGNVRWANLTARTDFALFLPDLLDACYAFYVLRINEQVQPDLWIHQFTK